LDARSPGAKGAYPAQREERNQRDRIFGKRSPYHDLAVDLAAAEDNAIARCECQAATNAAASHLDCFQFGPQHRIAQIVNPTNIKAAPGAREPSFGPLSDRGEKLPSAPNEDAGSSLWIHAPDPIQAGPSAWQHPRSLSRRWHRHGNAASGATSRNSNAGEPLCDRVPRNRRRRRMLRKGLIAKGLIAIAGLVLIAGTFDPRPADARGGYRGGGGRAVAVRGAGGGRAVAVRGGYRGGYRGAYAYRPGVAVGAAALGAAAIGSAAYNNQSNCYDAYGNYICGGYRRY
jgi:hypothetical protein